MKFGVLPVVLTLLICRLFEFSSNFRTLKNGKDQRFKKLFSDHDM
jgi:hypothetical protein